MTGQVAQMKEIGYNYTSRNRKEMTAMMLETPLQSMPKPVKEVRNMLYSTPIFPQDLENYAPWVATHGLLAPYGECQCGCEQETKFSRRSCPKTGYRKGDPSRFVIGHINGAKQTIAEAFWQYVIPGDPDACWEWQGGFRTHGYGALRHKGSSQMVAHRVSYELHYGPIPDGLDCLHKCDNPPCVNPRHLFLGTDADNVADMMAKGRNGQLIGESHPRAKLTEADIVEICRLRQTGMIHREIAVRFGVSRSTVAAILRGVAWSHLGQASSYLPSNPKAKLSVDKVIDIRHLASVGVSSRVLAEKFAIKPSTVRRIITRATWRGVR